jgi:hypothetical protein
VDVVLEGFGLAPLAREGEEVRIAVEDVGTGVGYVVCPSNASRFRFGGLGNAGDDEKGSKAGRRDVVGFLTAGEEGVAVSDSVVEEAMLYAPCYVWDMEASKGQLKARVQ